MIRPPISAAPRVGEGQAGVTEDREASSGHRAKQEREGPGGAGGHFLPGPGAAWFCKGSAARAGGAEAGSGPEARARARPVGAERPPGGGWGRRCGGQGDRAPGPPSPQRPRRLRLPALLDTSAKVLPFGAELGFPGTRPAPARPAPGPQKPLPSTRGPRPHPSRLHIPSRGLA